MRHVKLLKPLLIGDRNHAEGDIVLVNDERGADLIRARFAESSAAPSSDALANPDVNRLQDAIDPMPPGTYAPLSEDGLTAHIARATALVVDDAPGLVALRDDADRSPAHESTGAAIDRAADTATALADALDPASRAAAAIAARTPGGRNKAKAKAKAEAEGQVEDAEPAEGS